MDNKIAAIRKNKGIKQKELASILGVKVDTLGTWERGKREFSFIDACNIADALGCTLDELAGRTLIAVDEETAVFTKRFQRLPSAGRQAVMEMIDFQQFKSAKKVSVSTIEGMY